MIVSIVAFSIFAANFATSYGAESGPVGYIKIHYIENCEDVPEGDVKADLELIHDDDEGDTMKLYVDTPVDLSTGSGCQFEFVSDKWKDGDWQTNVYNTQDEPFGFVNKYVKRIWDCVRETVKPKIPTDCLIPAGAYEGIISAKATDADIPQILYGRFKVTVDIKCQDGIRICKVIEVDSTP